MSEIWRTASLTVANTATHSCGCIGPQNGQPRCPCRMAGIIERDGRWIELERDLGPVRQSAGDYKLVLADANSNKSPHQKDT